MNSFRSAVITRSKLVVAKDSVHLVSARRSGAWSVQVLEYGSFADRDKRLVGLETGTYSKLTSLPSLVCIQLRSSFDARSGSLDPHELHAEHFFLPLT